MSQSRTARVTAVLGPTNTGKTYLAIERMLAHDSGVIGFPLRLLARENYDRAVRLRGRRRVALVTGEEKIVPSGARYFFCTVESMPLDRAFAFLAVDEVQLCADPERGHVFTDRLLHARGTAETMFLGADTIRPLLRQLVPEAEYVSRPRFSTLSYLGPRKLRRLPPRSAVIAFSAPGVYALAELLRRQSGGTAVVLGALSPRTRNAQVELFESGEVDYLVATDAIGMGLNLHLDHVAFVRLGKFDGRRPRRLTPAEVGQIAGRAGRHMSDGTFGTSGDLGAMAPELVEAVEEHRFDPLPALFWRNRDLSFRSPQALLDSLERRPPSPALLRAREADDHLALAALLRDPEVARRARDPAAIRLLWEVCQVPDFQKILTEQHTGFLARIYHHLAGGEERLPEDWIAGQVARIDRTDGDIDALMARIAHVRTWTYVTHRGDWLADAAGWQERTRAIEDRLSDALHERLTQRFVDRRSAILLRRMKGGEKLIGAVRANGEVLVEGEYIGRLEGFRFLADEGVAGLDARPLEAAARRALTAEIPRRLRRLESDDDGTFSLDETGFLKWRGGPVARLAAGETPLAPRVAPLPSDLIEGAQRERVRRRLAAWLDRHVTARLGALLRLAEADLSGPARGIAYQIVEALGTVPRSAVAGQVSALGKADRRALAAVGVRLGEVSVFMPALLKVLPTRLRALLWAVHGGHAPPVLADLPPTLDLEGPIFEGFAGPAGGAIQTEALARVVGYRVVGRGRPALAVRADVLERLATRARKLATEGPFMPDGALRQATGLADEALAVLLPELGYRLDPGAAAPTYLPRGPGARKGRRAKGRKAAQARPDSPFAKLGDLEIAS
jgi:ATP-dependent RNA helicase SUPV3L1/SUV3